MMNWLGLTASYSRPRVSEDNSFVEAFFRAANTDPSFPRRALRMSPTGI